MVLLKSFGASASIARPGLISERASNLAFKSAQRMKNG
jgi:hypothetical protein